MSIPNKSFDLARSISKLKILFITCWYPTKEKPGFGVFVKEHAKAVSLQEGVDLKVLQVWPVKSRTIYRKKVRSFTDEHGIETHQIFIHSFAYKLIYLWNHFMVECANRYLNRYLYPEWKPDLIHGNVIFQAGMIAHNLAQKINVPYVITEHWSGLDWYANTPFVFSKAGLRAYRNADGIFPVSAYLKKKIRRFSNSAAQVKIIPNVVDTEVFRYEERQKNVRLQLLCVTNFARVKKISKIPALLLEAMKLFKEKNRQQYKIMVVGGGEDLPLFMKKIREFGLQDTIDCLGYQPKEQVADLMRESDFLAHPTIEETFGVVVAEALCCGTPCVVSDVSALKELVDDDCGIRVAENTPDSWYKVLSSLPEIRNHFDKRTISKRFENRFSPMAVGEMIVSQYREILESQN